MKRHKQQRSSALTINLESGRPLADEAVRRLRAAVCSARSQGVGAIKLIHGYGSSGHGGAIKSRVHRELAFMRKQGEITVFVSGEQFSPFDENARLALSICPELSGDSDYSRCNQGVTVVVL